MSIPKLKDIAAATGVHEMTVSRALRNVGRMRPETRQRVAEAARRLGYRPNAAASAMRTGRTGCIVMLSSPLRQSSHVSPDAMAAVMDAIAARGGYLVQASLPGNVDIADASTLPCVLRRQMAEGLLLHHTPDEPDRIADFLCRADLPAIWMNHKRHGNAIYPDDAGASAKVTEHLLALGHRRIAFVRLEREGDLPPRIEHYSVADRIAGYERTMRQAGLRPDVQVFTHRWDQWDEPVEARLQPLATVFCDPARCPTAVITHRDGPVMLSLLLQLGLRVPDDVSMVSFTACPSHAVEQVVSWVPLPFEEIGRKAVAMLYRLIEGGRIEIPAAVVPYGTIASLHTVKRIG